VNARESERRLEERERLLAIEADLQRATLAATFRKWEDRKLLAVGSTVAGWAWRLLAVPKVRWLVAATVLSRLRGGRRRHA
jgi:hypothetical protein